ncbi:MAG: sulfatase-like hydrolase/transferase, partial [Gammaproteobacteria bacterium]|nr:sulfatase-like hydrolase/transferase [Gammaproteobacteria bacterium]
MTRFELKVCAVVVAIAFLHSVSAHGQPANVEVQELLGGDGATLVRSGGSPPLDSETAVIGSGNAAEKKNVILIMADDFNHWLASVGYYPLAKTPNLDALAAKGVLFANTSSASPVCSSSRQALWSGLSPARTLIDTNVEPYIRDIPEYSDVLTMNQHFLQQGYYVYGGGKLYHSSRMGIGETDRKNWSGVYEGKTGAPAGEFYGWQGQANEGRIHWSASAAPIEDTDDTKLAMHMAEKISTYDRSENNDKPFFLAVGFYRPHLPWHAPKQFYDLYDPDKVEIPRGYFDNDLVD